METFFHFFEKRTGYDKPSTQQVIRIISSHLARNYKNEFAVIIQYFLSKRFEQMDPEDDINMEWQIKNLNV